MTISLKTTAIPLYDKGVKRHKAQKGEQEKKKVLTKRKQEKPEGRRKIISLPIGQLRLETNGRKILNNGFLSFHFRLRVLINGM